MLLEDARELYDIHIFESMTNITPNELMENQLNDNGFIRFPTSLRKSIVDDMNKISGIPKHMMNPPQEGWRIHPTWNEIYKLRCKKYGLTTYCVILHREGTSKVVVKDTHDSKVISIKEAKNKYVCFRQDDADQTPVEFAKEHSWFDISEPYTQ